MTPLKITNALDFGHVAVLMGGTAAEREISLLSGQAVYQALKNQGITTSLIDVNVNLIESLAQLKVDRIFNIIHGRGGEDGVLQAVLESFNIPYTGSGVLASALTMDKLRTKMCWRGIGLPTPKWYVFKNQHDIDGCIETLGFPMMVKPAKEGSSLGMSKACNREELVAALTLAYLYNCDVYAEQWVKGKEYTVGILADEALPVIGLETPNQFYDFEAKYKANTTLYHCPCDLGETEEKQLQALALHACQSLEVKGWARVDVFIDDNNHYQLIEINTVPGMTDHSLVPMAAKQAGIDFNELVWRILETSLTVSHDLV